MFLINTLKWNEENIDIVLFHFVNIYGSTNVIVNYSWVPYVTPTDYIKEHDSEFRLENNTFVSLFKRLTQGSRNNQYKIRLFS